MGSAIRVLIVVPALIVVFAEAGKAIKLKLNSNTKMNRLIILLSFCYYHHSSFLKAKKTKQMLGFVSYGFFILESVRSTDNKCVV
jgi:hypothetical protein